MQISLESIPNMSDSEKREALVVLKKSMLNKTEEGQNMIALLADLLPDEELESDSSSME